MSNTEVIYTWCKQRYIYYNHRVNKTLLELWDDVKIMLSKSDRVKGDYSFFATFMFWQCERHNLPIFLAKIDNSEDLFCVDSNYMYHPVEGKKPMKLFRVNEFTQNGETWKTI